MGEVAEGGHTSVRFTRARAPRKRVPRFLVSFSLLLCFFSFRVAQRLVVAAFAGGAARLILLGGPLPRALLRRWS